MEGDVVMILGLPPILGFLPLVLYIILMMKGKDMNLSVLICVILGAVMTGESVSGFGTVLQNSLSSFLSLIGFIIVLGSGLGEVLTRTKVAHNIVHLVIGKAKLKSKKQAIFIAMCTSTLLVSMLGTLSGSNAIIAPILIPIMASLGITTSTLGVILHGADVYKRQDYDLSIMQERQTLFDVTTNILNRIKEVLENEKPDTVLVHRCV